MDNAKKSKIAVYCRFGARSTHAQSSLAQRDILNKYSDQYEIVFAQQSGLHKKMSDLWAKVNDEYKIMRVRPTWHELYKNQEHNLFDLTGIEHCVLFGSPTLSGKYGNHPERFNLDWEEILDGSIDMNIIMTFGYLFMFVSFVLEAKKMNIPIHQIVYDPEEISIPFATRYFGYEWADSRRLDSLQYSLLSASFKFETEKSKDFTFGFTAANKDRIKILDQLQANLDTSKMFIKCPKRNIDSEVSRELYMHEIEKSRFTLIIPAYNIETFSIYRFIESIHEDCLPLILDDCAIDDVEKSFDVDLKPLLVSYNQIMPKMKNMKEEERLNLLSYYKKKFLVVEKLLDI